MMYLGVIVKTPGRFGTYFTDEERYILPLAAKFLHEPIPNIALNFGDWTYPEVVILRPDGSKITTTFRRIQAHLNFHPAYRASHAPNFVNDDLTLPKSVGELPINTLIFWNAPREATPYISVDDLAVVPLTPSDVLSIFRWVLLYNLDPWLARYATVNVTNGERREADWITDIKTTKEPGWLHVELDHLSTCRGGGPPHYGIILYQEMPIGIAQWEHPRGELQDALGYPLDDRVFLLDLLIGEPTFQRNGIGSRTARHLARWLCSQNARTVIAAPDITNIAAIRSFERAGFVALEPRIVPTEDDNLRECLVMEWDDTETSEQEAMC